MATLQGKAVKNTYRQVLQIGANNVGVSGALQPVQDGAGVNTALSLSTAAATINGTLTITGDLIITGGGIQIQDLIDDTVASLIQNGTGITWAYNDTLRTLTPTITIATADGGVQGDFMQLNTGANEANAVGKIYWNSSEGGADLGLLGGQVILPIGQKQVARVLNNSGSILNKSAYQVVKITAAQGQRLAVGLAQANNDANSTDTLGLVAENIANNQEGFITSSGLITNVDTTGDLQLEDWNDGDVLYLSPTTPGAITKVKPVAPQHTVIVGFVVYAHKNNGKIYVKVDNGYELDELHNVRITSVANNNVLRYNSSLAVWENVAPITTWITEGTNLYYTQGRFDSAFAAKSTTNLAEGTNLYWTTARGNVNFATNLAASTTTNLAEGTNLYFTNQRFDSRFGTKTTTDLTEGTNLYYTQARFNTAFDAKTTTDLDEGTNLYYTDARARLALASSATGLTYANNSGVFSLTAGYAIPTTVKLGQYDIAYNRSIVSAAVTGTSTKTLSLTQQDANVITATWTDQGITTINGTANQIAATTVGNTTTLAFTNDVTMPNNLVVSGNLTINGTATYVNTQSISAKDPLFEVANDNNTTDAVDIGYYGRYYDSAQTRVEFTGLFRDASDAGKFKFFTGLVSEPTNVVDTTGTGYTVGTLVANFEGNLAGTANAANILSTARTIAASGDATWSVSFNGSANVSSALTLVNTGVTATTYGTTTAVPTIAVDSKGRITSASNTNIAFPVTTVNGQAGTVVLTTSDIAEGSNQYFTSARAQAAISGTAPISVASGVVSISQSGGASNGFLSSTDWNTFNNKLSTATAATTYVPYTGATGNVNIGTYTLSAAQVRATSSAGLSINANSGTQIADFGAGGGANMTLFGGLSGTSASFSGSVSLSNLNVNNINANNNGLDDIGSLGGNKFRNVYASSFVKTAGTSSQFLMADGSVNTSVLASGAYLPLAGGTLTGALSGTSATFSGAVTSSFGTAGVNFNSNAATTGSVNAYRASNTNGVGSYGIESNAGGSLMTLGLSNATLLQSVSNTALQLGTNQTARLTILSGGNVGIGTNNPAYPLEITKTSGDVYLNIARDSKATGQVALRLAGGTGGTNWVIYQDGSADDLQFFGNGAERMRITSGGWLKLREATASTTSVHILRGDTITDAVAQVVNANISTTSDGMFTVVASRNTSNNTFYALGYYNSGAGNWKFRVADSGNVTNTNNSYGVLSDIKLKENIVDATPKLDDLLKVKIRNYNLIGEETKQIGVIAQELEEVFPSMVDESEDFEEVEITDEEGNTTKEKKSVGTTTKSVKMSVFVPMLIKAIQEQQAQIEELKALIAAK